MSFYGDQLKERLENDARSVRESERRLGSLIGGRGNEKDYEDLSYDRNIRQIEMIARYFHLETTGRYEKVKTTEELIEEVMGTSEVPKRRVHLDGTWWKDGDGPLLVRLKESGDLKALFPGAVNGYYNLDPDSGEKIRITKHNCNAFEEYAFCFYRPLPQGSLSGKEFITFLLKGLRKSDIALYVTASILLSLIGTIPSFATQLAFSQILPTQKYGLLISLFIMLLSTACGAFLMRSARFALNLRIQGRLSLTAQNSVYARVLNLPFVFFKERTAGSLSRTVRELNRLPKILGDILMMITSIMISFVSIVPIFTIAPELAPPALVSILLILAVLGVCIVQEQKLLWNEMMGAKENSGLVFGLISGIERLKLSGSEDRAYAKWLRVYAKKAGASFAVRFPLVARAEIITTIKLLGLLWAFAIAFSGQLSVAQLATFSSAYGVAIGCLDTIAKHARNISRIRPILKNGESLLQTVPESGEGRKKIRKLDGHIEVNRVTFRYSKGDPAVLRNFSMSILPGEYVAIVGKSGCGKSTLVKLLLGFETPENGSISYDGTEMNKLNLRSLRKCIGTVLQDGKLFAGDIFSNITITAPELGMEEAWEAAEKAGMADDIRKMPRGMNTMLGEGNGGISGGQRQRLMIARAIVAKPGVIIFDEATSALDNLTQKIVTDSMNEMNCTRIVIAHRLSTIRECDRIIAIDQGNIVESGTYDELMAKNGFFAELVARQQIEEQSIEQS